MMDFILKMSDFTELVKREAAMTSEQREWRVLHNAGQFLCINDDSSIEKNEDSSTENEDSSTDKCRLLQLRRCYALRLSGWEQLRVYESVSYVSSTISFGKWHGLMRYACGSSWRVRIPLMWSLSCSSHASAGRERPTH